MGEVINFRGSPPGLPTLAPEPSPSEIKDRTLYRVRRMRLTPKYEALSERAQAVVEHLVDEVIAREEPNGNALRSQKDWMTVLNTRSSSQTEKAVKAALASGLINRSKGRAPTLEGGRPSYRYGLRCLDR